MIQVVPRLTPGRCGITDHAILLAGELEAACGIATAFVVLTPNVAGDLPFPVTPCAPAELLESCQSLAPGRVAEVLVHLSGYGYSPDGAPTALAAALERLKASGRSRVAVYFHELFAGGPPWKSAFWHASRQKRAVARIARQCDLLLTNTQLHVELLKREVLKASGVQVTALPVFSTIGESEELPPFACREPVVVVFGLAATRTRSYKLLQALGGTLERLGVKEIVDVGPSSDIPRQSNGIAVRCAGELPAVELARLLSSSRFGFMPHPPFSMGKSSIFAGYCAQGVIPVVAESFGASIDGLVDGTHLLSPATAGSEAGLNFQALSDAGWRWYRKHRLHAHAETYRNWLVESASERAAQAQTATATARA